MSCRHPEAHTKDTTAIRNTKAACVRGVLRGSRAAILCVVVTISIGNGRDLPRLERLEEPPRAFDIELRIGRLDAQEEPVAAGQREPWHVEHGVIRLRQAVQRK